MDGLSLARSHTHTHTRSTANGVAAMAMALHEAFIVCLFLSFVHGLPKIYCHPARWIRLALSHSLTDTHTEIQSHTRLCSKFSKTYQIVFVVRVCRVDSNADI